jgi:hypothetical protein
MREVMGVEDNIDGQFVKGSYVKAVQVAIQEMGNERSAITKLRAEARRVCVLCNAAQAEKESADCLIKEKIADKIRIKEGNMCSLAKRFYIVQAYPEEDKLGHSLIWFSVEDHHHKVGRVVAAVVNQKGQGPFLLDRKVLLKVARKSNFALIRRILEDRTDSQHKLQQSEVLCNVAFRKAVEAAGYPDTAMALEIFGGVCAVFDTQGLTQEKRYELSERYRQLFCAMYPEWRCSRKVPGRKLGIPRGVLFAFMGNIDSTQLYQLCYPHKPLKHRNTGTYVLEGLFSSLVQKVGFKPSVDRILEVLNGIIRVTWIRMSPLRCYFWTMEKNAHYDHSESALTVSDDETASVIWQEATDVASAVLERTRMRVMGLWNDGSAILSLGLDVAGVHGRDRKRMRNDTWHGSSVRSNFATSS